MNEMVNTQTLLFLRSLQIGVLLAMMYDLVRIFRKAIPHLNWMIQVEDILYWVVSTGIGFGMIYVHNYGEIRPYIFLGMIIGAIIYLITLSILFMKVATWIIDQVKRLLVYLIRILSIPIKWLVSLLAIPLGVLNRSGKQLDGYRRIKNKQFKRAVYYKQSDKRVQQRLKQDMKHIKRKVE